MDLLGDARDVDHQNKKENWTSKEDQSDDHYYGRQRDLRDCDGDVSNKETTVCQRSTNCDSSETALSSSNHASHATDIPILKENEISVCVRQEDLHVVREEMSQSAPSSEVTCLECNDMDSEQTVESVSDCDSDDEPLKYFGRKRQHNRYREELQEKMDAMVPQQINMFASLASQVAERSTEGQGYEQTFGDDTDDEEITQ